VGSARYADLFWWPFRKESYQPVIDADMVFWKCVYLELEELFYMYIVLLAGYSRSRLEYLAGGADHGYVDSEALKKNSP